MHLKYCELPEDLHRRLRRIYLITGDEPMQKIDATDRIRKTVRAKGFETRYSFNLNSGIDETLWEGAFAGDGLFSSKVIIEVYGERLPKKNEQELLESAVPKLNDDIVLVVVLPKVDRKTAQSRWFKTLSETGAWLSVWPISLADLPQFLMEQAAWQSRKLTKDAAERMAQWVDGNLLAARQTLSQLVFLTGHDETIDLDLVTTFCSDNARFTPWQAIDAALSGENEKLPRLIRRLQETDVAPMVIARSLQNTLRQLIAIAQAPVKVRPARMKEMGIWTQKQSLYNKALQRWSAGIWSRLLIRAYHLEAMVVGQRHGNFWDACLELCLIIAGKRIQVPYDSQ